MKKLLSVWLGCCLLLCLCLAGCQSDEQKIAELLSLGQNHLLQQNYDGVQSVFDEIMAIDEKSAEAYLLLAKAQAQKGDLPTAIKTLQTGAAATGHADVAALQKDYEAQHKKAEEEALRAQTLAAHQEELAAVAKELDGLDDGENPADILSDERYDDLIEAAEYARDNGETLYVGDTDADGLPSGQGTGLYWVNPSEMVAQSMYDPFTVLYTGAWADGLPSGQGTARILEWHSQFTGSWANGLPNGPGQLISGGQLWSEGSYVNGVAEGAYTLYAGSTPYTFQCTAGIAAPISSDPPNIPELCDEAYYCAQNGDHRLASCPHVRYMWFGSDKSHV